MVAQSGIFRPVVSIGKSTPIFCAKIFNEVGVEQEVGEELKLGTLRVAHFFNKVIETLGSTSFPIRAGYLKHTPHSGFFGGDAVYEACSFEPNMFFLLLCAGSGDMCSEV